MNTSSAARSLDEIGDIDSVPGDLIGLFDGAGNDDLEHCDGRTQRRTRNRERVIASMVELVRGGNQNPSVAQIADSAGVSHRSVFRYFVDLDDLVRAAVDYEVQHALPLGTLADPGVGTFEQRVDALVDARLRIFAHTSLTGRLAQRSADSIPSVEQALVMIYQVLRTQARIQFSDELLARSIEDAEFTLDAVTMLVSFRSYDMHRRIGHTPERIRMVWKLGLLALLRN